MPELLVGVDIGTTLTKAAVVGLNRAEVACGQSATPWRAVPTGAECDAEELFDAVLSALSAAMESAPEGHIRGLGVTSFAETVVYLGADGQPVRPSIAWHATRGAEQAQDLARSLGERAFSERTGLLLSPICTLVKLAWLGHHGALGRKGRSVTKVLSIADWVAHRLGAEQVSEASLASRTGALDLSARRWWDEGLEWAGLPRDLFPAVVQAGELSGTVGAGNAKASLGSKNLGRLLGAALCTAGHDHLCAAVGAGAIGAEQVVDSCGTAEALVRGVPPLPPSKVAQAVGSGLNVSWHTVPGRQALLISHFLGMILERVLSLLGVTTEEGLRSLDTSAELVGPGDLRVEQSGPYAEPWITGLGPGVSTAALWSAALDAVAARAPDAIRAMGSLAGPARELVLIGGWAHCAGLQRRKSHLLPAVRWPVVGEEGARGAALFGGCAAGVFGDPADFPRPPDRAVPLLDPVLG